MGMFDFYLPRPDLQFPVCGASELEWQGKEARCGLFVWEQGQKAPVDQRVDDECKIASEARAEFRLPIRFEIYSRCRCPTFLQAVGFTNDEVWTRTELMSPTNAVPYPNESEREFQKRLDGYAAHLGHAYKTLQMNLQTSAVAFGEVSRCENPKSKIGGSNVQKEEGEPGTPKPSPPS